MSGLIGGLFGGDGGGGGGGGSVQYLQSPEQRAIFAQISPLVQFMAQRALQSRMQRPRMYGSQQMGRFGGGRKMNPWWTSPYQGGQGSMWGAPRYPQIPYRPSPMWGRR